MLLMRDFDMWEASSGFIRGCNCQSFQGTYHFAELRSVKNAVWVQEPSVLHEVGHLLLGLQNSELIMIRYFSAKRERLTNAITLAAERAGLH